jgi:hypothetical protein
MALWLSNEVPRLCFETNMCDSRPLFDFLITTNLKISFRIWKWFFCWIAFWKLHLKFPNQWYIIISFSWTLGANYEKVCLPHAILRFKQQLLPIHCFCNGSRRGICNFTLSPVWHELDKGFFFEPVLAERNTGYESTVRLLALPVLFPWFLIYLRICTGVLQDFDWINCKAGTVTAWNIWA